MKEQVAELLAIMAEITGGLGSAIMLDNVTIRVVPMTKHPTKVTLFAHTPKGQLDLDLWADGGLYVHSWFNGVMVSYLVTTRYQVVCRAVTEMLAHYHHQ